MTRGGRRWLRRERGVDSQACPVLEEVPERLGRFYLFRPLGKSSDAVDKRAIPFLLGSSLKR